MSRGRIGVTLAVCALVLLLVGWSQWEVWRRCSQLADHAEQAQIALYADADITAELETLTEQWETDEPWLRLLLPNAQVAAVQDSMVRLQPLYRSDCDELGAELAALQSALTRMYRIGL